MEQRYNILAKIGDRPVAKKNNIDAAELTYHYNYFREDIHFTQIIITKTNKHAETIRKQKGETNGKES